MKNKGITLIALVVTIIVLLILAGVSISLLVGENGIITNAMRAREETKIAQENELRNLAIAEAATNFENTEYNGVTIPAGFAPTRIEGEDSVEEGLVIIDSEGNEFVWIPCTETQYDNDSVRDENWISDDSYKNDKSWREKYEDSDVEKLNETYTNENALPTEKWKNENQIEKAKTSVKKYGGFYIARYEAGIPEEATQFYVSSSSSDLSYKNIEGSKIYSGAEFDDGEPARGSHSDTSKIKNLKPVSKKGYQAWNYITQPNAKLVAENMYDGSKSIGSYLVDSQAWNIICKKFDTILNSKENGKSIRDSTEIGNYLNNKTTKYEGLKCLNALHTRASNNWIIATNYKTTVGITDAPKGEDNNNNRLELSTGASDDFKVYNIYDMAGNVAEWTTEHSIRDDKMYVVPRGR